MFGGNPCSMWIELIVLLNQNGKGSLLQLSNYTHYQYKCAIAMIWGFGILYLQFCTTLHVNKGLIKNSVIFKIVKIPLSWTSYQWSVPLGAQSLQTLYYITLF